MKANLKRDFNRAVPKSAPYYFFYKQFWHKGKEEVFLIAPRDVTISLIIAMPVHKIWKQNLGLTATQFNIQSIFDWWYLNFWNWTFPFEMKALMGKTGELLKYRNQVAVTFSQSLYFSRKEKYQLSKVH